MAAFREKTRKHQQTQELYDRLKRKEMTAATQSAAFESVDNVLGSASVRRGAEPSSIRQPQEHARFQPFDAGSPSAKQPTVHHRRSSNHSQEAVGMMLPPPFRRPIDHATNGSLGGKSSVPTIFTESNTILATPSNHRTRLGLSAHSPGRTQSVGYGSASAINRISPLAASSLRPSFGDFNGHNVSRNGLTGYGMSAGMKVGRQPGEIPSNRHSKLLGHRNVVTRSC